MKFKLLEEYLVETQTQDNENKAAYTKAPHNPFTCPQCMAQLKGEVSDEQPAQNVTKKGSTKKIVAKKVVAKETNESFEYDLEPDKDYYFMHNNHLTKGKFKYKTKSWQVFEREDGEEVRINSWSNVATTPEDITGVEQVVDRLEKDTKVPNVLHLPNRFIK